MQLLDPTPRAQLSPAAARNFREIVELAAQAGRPYLEHHSLTLELWAITRAHVAAGDNSPARLEQLAALTRELGFVPMLLQEEGKE